MDEPLDHEYVSFLEFLSQESLIHLRNVLEHLNEMGLAGDEMTDQAEDFLDDFKDFIFEEEFDG